MRRILILNGPSLNYLGYRENALYGKASLTQINANLQQLAIQHNIKLCTEQSNSEGTLIDYIYEAKENGVDYIIINAGAYSHTSIAIRDALAAVTIPFIEVHITNIHARENFRHHSYLSSLAMGVIYGFGSTCYSMALNALIDGKVNLEKEQDHAVETVR